MRSSSKLHCRSIRLRRRGMFVLEALLGLMLIVAIAAALGAVVAKQQRAAILTAGTRAAVRQAEAALTLLQSGRPALPDVAVKRLDAPAPAGWMWVEATGQSGSRTATVAGLVPFTGGGR